MVREADKRQLAEYLEETQLEVAAVDIREVQRDVDVGVEHVVTREHAVVEVRELLAVARAVVVVVDDSF